MNPISRRIARLPFLIGWALLVAASVLGLALLLPAVEEGQTLADELRQLPRRVSTADSIAPPAYTVSQQLEEFLSSLPAQDQINTLLTKLYDIAASNQLTLRNGEYRTTTSKGGAIRRLQITVKSVGSYKDFRRLLLELTEVLPSLSVSRFSMTRQKPSDTALEIILEFTLYTRA